MSLQFLPNEPTLTLPSPIRWARERSAAVENYETNPLRSARRFKVPGFRFQVVQELRNEAISEAVK